MPEHPTKRPRPSDDTAEFVASIKGCLQRDCKKPRTASETLAQIAFHVEMHEASMSLQELDTNDIASGPEADEETNPEANTGTDADTESDEESDNEFDSESDH
eukprot:2606970-Rhodomonas_salina.2